MPKRKKLPKTPDYDGMGIHSDNAEIQKSRPLQSLSETDLTLPEFKILDAYLARINSYDNSKRTVKLEKGQLEKALGVTRILKDDLNKRLRHLFQVIEVKDKSKSNGFKLINLFEEADAEQDANGLWQITLTCTQSAREYVFNIDNIGYLRYRLKNVINLTSRYSYVLFLYLIDNRFRKTWSIDFVELKVLLNCNADTYKQYYRFNELVLKKCHKELREKTDISFEYKPIKRGRSVSAIEFTVKTFADKVQSLTDQNENGSKQLSFADTYSDYEETEPIDYGSDLADLLGETCFNEFSPEQIRVIQDLVLQFVGHDAIKCSDYLTHKLNITNAYCKRKDTESRYKYLLRMINNDIKNPDRAL